MGFERAFVESSPEQENKLFVGVSYMDSSNKNQDPLESNNQISFGGQHQHHQQQFFYNHHQQQQLQNNNQISFGMMQQSSSSSSAIPGSLM